MSKRLLAQTVIAYVAGIAFAWKGYWFLPAGILPVFVIINWSWIKGRKYTIAAGLFLAWAVLFLSGFGHTETELAYRNSYRHCLEKESTAVLQGTIYKKEKKNEQYLIYLKNVILKVENQKYSTNHVLIYQSTDAYPIGKTIVVKGKIKDFSPAANEGGFDQRLYYQSLKIDYEFEAEEVLGCYGKENVWQNRLYLLKEKLKQNYINITDAKNAAILSMMVLGDTQLMDAETKTLYQYAGITHVLVISGMHISMIGAGLYGLLRRCRGGFLLSAVSAGILLCFYAQMTGWGVSTIRAVLMFAVAMLAKCLGRTYDTTTGLALAVFLLLTENPFLIGYSGFQLSVGALIGIILAGEKTVEWRMNGMIQLVTLPLIACTFYEVPVWGLLVNLVILPFSGCLLISGMAGTAAACITPWLGKLLVFPAWLILWFYEAVCRLVQKLPYTMWMTGKPAWIPVILYYILLLWGVRCFRKRRLLKKKELEARCEIEEKQKVTEKYADRNRWGQKLVLRYTECRLNFKIYGIRRVLWILCLLSLFVYQAPHPTTIDVLDVGQGDGICIRLKTGVNLFVDGGSTDVSQVGKYRILPYLKYHRIRQIDYWFVSHLDTDHVSGLIEVMQSGYPVKHLLFAETAVKNENWDTLVVLAGKYHTDICYMKPGTAVRSGESVAECVFPEKNYPSDDINARSMVLLFREKQFSGILTGDITEEEEKWLLQHTGLSDITWYKAAHHGSRYSNSSTWLTKLSPLLSTISYGENNWYGHPSAEAVKHMEEAGSRVFCTAKEGEITLLLSGESVKITKYRNPLEVMQYSVIK